MKFSKLLALALSAAIAVSAAGCSQSEGDGTRKKSSIFSKVNTYSAKDMWDITLTGDDGTGTLKASRNRDFEKKIISECMPEDATELEEAAYQVLLETMEIDGEPCENLSNGDKVEIHISLDEEALKQRGIAFTDTDFTYTVEGLESYEEIDVFKDVVITYDGIAPYARPQAEYKGTDEFVLNNVSVSVKESGSFKNGDTFTVITRYSDETLDEAKVKLKETKKEYTVENADEYILEEFDTTKVDSDIDNALSEISGGEYSNYAIGSEARADVFFKRGDKTHKGKYRVLEQHCKPMRNVLIDYGYSGNKYKRYYQLYYDIENVETGEKTVSDNMYFVGIIEGVVRQADGSLYYKKDIDWIDYRWSQFFGTLNHIGCDFSEIASTDENSSIIFEVTLE